MTMSAEWARRLTDDDEWIVRTALSSIASDLEKVADEAKRANPGGPIDRVEGGIRESAARYREVLGRIEQADVEEIRRV